MNNSLRHIGVFIGLILFQVLVLNNVNVGGLVNPYVYPLFVLILPMDIAGWALLTIAFFTGLTIDVFAGTLGMHAFSTVLMAGLRPILIDRITQRNVDISKSPGLKLQGFTWMLIYLLVMFAIHHFAYFLIEYWSIEYFGTITLKFLLNTIISVFISFLLLYAFTQAAKR